MSYAATILADNPIAYYPMDDASGTLAHDASGNHNDALLSGGFTLGQPGAIAGSAGSILFTSTGTITMPYTLNITTAPFTLEFWINITSIWQYVAITYDGTTTTVYLNAALYSAGTDGTIGISTLFDFIGTSVGGRLDEIAAYASLLTQEQISNHYRIGTSSISIATIPVYTFGSFRLNNSSGGLGYFLVGKEIPLPTVKPVVFPIARRDGVKKSGEFVDGRTITVALKIVGTSRLDLISRIDTLQQALSLRGQQLCIHEDNRYYRDVDATSAPIKFTAGNGIVQCDCAIVFQCYDPYAYGATTNTYDTGPTVLTAAGGSWAFPTISLTDTGTTYSLPFIRVYNRTSTGSTTLSASLTNGLTYSSIAVNATTFSGAVGDQIIITDGATTQTLTVASTFAIGATSITIMSFTASTNYISGDVVNKSTQWTSVVLTQTIDNLTLLASNTLGAPLPSGNGDYIDIQCDPSVQNGWTIQTNSSGLFIEPIGLFPVIEPGATTFTISIVSGSAVSAECVITWASRYAS